jgi:hypothetical protein
VLGAVRAPPHIYILCNCLTVYFNLQVKNKPNGRIAFHGFILGAGVVMNRNFVKEFVVLVNNYLISVQGYLIINLFSLIACRWAADFLFQQQIFFKGTE